MPIAAALLVFIAGLGADRPATEPPTTVTPEMLRAPRQNAPQTRAVPVDSRVSNRVESRIESSASNRVENKSSEVAGKAQSAAPSSPTTPPPIAFGQDKAGTGIFPDRARMRDEAGTAQALADYFRQSRSEYRLTRPYNEGFGRSFKVQDALGSRVRVEQKGAPGLGVYEATDRMGNKVRVQQNARGGYDITDTRGNRKTISERDLLNRGTGSALSGRR